MIDWDWVRAECDRLKKHRTLEELFAHLESFADKLEFFQLAYTLLPSFYQPGANRHPPINHTTYDGSWMEHYTDNRYDLEDSALKHCQSGSDAPYVWPHFCDFDQLSPKERRVFLEAWEVGIRHGFTLPMRSSGDGIGILSLSFDGSEREFENFYASRRKAAETFAYSFNEAVNSHFAKHFGKPHLPRLTHREKETIRWLAAGCTYGKTAEKMKVCVGTVQKHVSAAIRKLKARNSTHACALAVRWGMIE